MPPSLSVCFDVQHPASFPFGTSDSPTIQKLQTNEWIFLCLGEEIRTPDPLVPNQMRYQTALHRVDGALRETRTPDPEITNHVLYQSEL